MVVVLSMTVFLCAGGMVFCAGMLIREIKGERR